MKFQKSSLVRPLAPAAVLLGLTLLAVAAPVLRPEASVQAPAPQLPAAPSDLRLWYRQPAATWIEALPVGNGRLGAMVFGGTQSELIQLNEDTVWTGGPYDPHGTGAGAKALPEIRRLVFEGKGKEAEALFEKEMMAKIAAIEGARLLWRFKFVHFILPV